MARQKFDVGTLQCDDIYFDTTNLKEYALQVAIKSARNQNALIYSLFQYAYEDKKKGVGFIWLTPSEIHGKLIWLGHRYPITSVRRSLTVLTDNGYLEKTSMQKTGEWGRPEHYWGLPQ